PHERRRRCRRREGGSASSLDPPGRTAPRNSGRRRPTGRRGSATVRSDLRANLVARPAVCQGVEHVGAPAPTDDPGPAGGAVAAGRRRDRRAAGRRSRPAHRPGRVDPGGAAAAARGGVRSAGPSGPAHLDTGCDLRGRRPSASRGVPVVTYSGAGQTFDGGNRCVLPDTRHKMVTVGTRPGRTSPWRPVFVVTGSR